MDGELENVHFYKIRGNQKATRKILLLNRRIVKHITPAMFMCGVIMLVVVGADLLPSWHGLVLIYGSYLFFFSYIVDQIVIPVITYLKKAKRQPREG